MTLFFIIHQQHVQNNLFTINYHYVILFACTLSTVQHTNLIHVIIFPFHVQFFFATFAPVSADVVKNTHILFMLVHFCFIIIIYKCHFNQNLSCHQLKWYTIILYTFFGCLSRWRSYQAKSPEF